MNIQENCSDVPEQSTDSNYGLLLSKKYRIKISENYSKFVYKKFFLGQSHDEPDLYMEIWEGLLPLPIDNK